MSLNKPQTGPILPAVFTLKQPMLWLNLSLFDLISALQITQTATVLITLCNLILGLNLDHHPLILWETPTRGGPIYVDDWLLKFHYTPEELDWVLFAC